MTRDTDHVRQIASAASIVGIATLCSRILGFVRDMAIAWLFGAGMMADAFFVAFRIPSTLRELLGEGALSAAFVPAFTRENGRGGREAAWDLASAVMGTLMVVLAAVSVLGVLLAPAIVHVLAPGFAEVPGKHALTVQLLRVMFPYIFLVGLAALLMAILNSLGHFLTPALSPTVLNISMIAAVLLTAFGTENPALPLAVAVVVGGAGQLAIQVPSALSRGWRPKLRVAPRDPRVREIARLMTPGVAGLAVTQVNVFVGTLLASFLAEGSVATLTYAFRLVQFPIGVIGVAIATGALPVMAAFAAKDAMGDMKEALQSSLRLAFFLTVPAIVGLALFRLPILHVLFERGAFTRPVTQLTADILLGYTVGLCFYVGNRILAPAFYAMHDTWTPVKTAMMAVGVNIAASIVLMRSMGASGLALATAIASAGNFLLLFIALRRRIGGLGARRILAAAARVVGACVPMAVWGVVSQAWWDILAVRGTASKISLLCVELAIAMAVFLVTAAWLGCDELAWARDLLRRRRESGSVSTF
jgi:putative peptidoglycan lipid II flippase